MATNFNPATKISVSGPLSISDKRSADMPLDIRGRIETLTDITTIPFAWEGMLVYVRDTKKYYKVTSLANRTVGGVAIPYYPATWVEFGSGGSTPSPTPSEIDAGDVSYFSSGTFSNNTVGKELQSLASDILSLAEDIHNLSGDIGTLSNLNTENKQDLVSAINEVLVSTGSTITVINNLVSNSTTDALSAYQGKVLKGLVDGKVAGIKVQGESSVLPMVDGIVTIPAGGGGGTGTITGATVGGSPVTESVGILQFDAYPTANTMQYSSSTNYDSGTIGKEVKDLNESVNDLSTKVAELDKPSPTPSPSTTVVNLANYTASGSSFTYDVDNKYIYNTKDTTFYQYSEEDNATTIYYGVFKVIGEDRYLMYSITNNTTFTYVNTYTELTLPANAKKEFALGSVAVVKRVNGEGESWKNGTVNLFCTKQNMALRNRCRNINFNGSTAWRVFIKSEDGNTIFVYKAKSNGNYEWEINVPRSSTANFNLLDKYFDRKTATDIPYNDTNSLLNVSTVQQAIQKLAIGIGDGVSTVRILLKKNNEQVIANQQVNISVTYQGEPFDLTTQESYDNGFYTNSNGIVELLLPLGAVYNITYNNFNNDYSTPDSVSGIVDRTILTITGLYVAISENESILFIVNVLGADASVRPTDKEIYIDIYNQQNTPVHTYTCILASNGTPKTIKDTSNNVIKSGTSNVTLDLAKNVKFRARLQLWDTNLTEEEQSYIASGTQERTTRATRFTMYFSYQNTQTGLFLVVKDSSNAKGFTEYKITNIDTTNNIINISIGGVDYTVTKDSNNIIYKKETSDSSVQPSQWFTVAESADILGIGCRTSTLIAEPVIDQPTNDLGFTNCCFMVPRTFIKKVGKHQNIVANSTYFNCWSNVSGIHQTRQLSKIEGTMVSPIAQDIIDNNILTLSTPNGNISINGFACSTAQFTAFNANIAHLSIHGICTYPHTGSHVSPKECSSAISAA